VSNGGRVLSFGVNGTVFGFRANLVIADDLIRSREEAYSDGQRDKLYIVLASAAIARPPPR
jgi:hypothetical protein